MDPILLGYLALPLGYLGFLLGVSHAANSLLNRGHVNQAIRLFRLGLKLNLDRTNRLLCRSNLMASYHAIENYDAVAAEWLEIEPHLKDLVPFAGLAVACYCATLVCKGQYRQAAELSGRPEALLPARYEGNPTAELCESLRLTNKGAALTLMGELDEATACIEKAVERSPANSILSQHLKLVQGRLRYQQGLTEEAAEMLKGIDTAQMPLLYVEELELNRAKLLARCGQAELAADLLQVVGCLDTNRLRLLRLEALAAIAEQRGDPERALGYYAQLLPSGLPAGETFLRAGNLARSLGDTDLTTAFFKAALSYDPESCWAKIAQKRLES